MSDYIGGCVETCRQVGHTLIRGFLEPGIAGALRCEVMTLVNRRADRGRAMYFFEEESSGARRLVRVERIWEALPVLASGETGARLFALAEAYLGGPAAIFKDKLNIRHAGSQGYAPHQDSAAGWDAFAPRFLSIGVFLDLSNSKRGGFEVVDNAHRRGRLDNNKGKMSLDQFRLMNPHAIDADQGDIILLDSEAPHRTFDNVSEDDCHHLLITFMPRCSEDLRSAYYDKKAIDLEGDLVNNEFKFRVFSFR